MNWLRGVSGLGIAAVLLASCNMGPLRERPPAYTGPAATDQQFARQAAESGMAVLALGELAESRAGDVAVRDFARRMAEEHRRAHQQLLAAAEAEGITVPGAVGQEYARLRQELAALSGAQFDRQFMAAQVSEHQRALELYRDLGRATPSERLSRYANDTLPMLQAHLQHAQETASQLESGRSP